MIRFLKIAAFSLRLIFSFSQLHQQISLQFLSPLLHCQRFLANFSRFSKFTTYLDWPNLTKASHEIQRHLCNPISLNCTKKSKKWLYEISQFLQIFKILAFSLCQRLKKRTRFKAIWHVFSNPHFFLLGLGKACNVLAGESRRKRVSFFPFGTSKT